MFNYTDNLYAVGVGDFIAYKGGQFASMGKVNIETMFEFSASNLDIRGGKRAPLRMRYSHSSEATFSIISATYNPNLWKASMGGEDRSFANLPAEESVKMNGRTITLAHNPVAVGDIPAQVWIQYNNHMYSAIQTTDKTIVLPSTNSSYESIPDNADICVIYNYKNINASAVTIPAELAPDIWHIFIDVDVATDKSGSGIVGRTVIEIPLGQLDPAQTFNATLDGYSQSKVTGVMLAVKGTSGCGGKNVYAYINTEIFDQKWYDNIISIHNSIDDVEIATNGTYTIELLGLEYNNYYREIDIEEFENLNFEFLAGTATGTTFDNTTGVVTAGTTAGTATLQIKVVDDNDTIITRIPTYTLEIVVE